MNTLGWTLIESDEADSLIGPPRPANCPAGWTTHTWTVTIEEGRLAFTTDECDLCARGIEDLEPELIGGGRPPPASRFETQEQAREAMRKTNDNGKRRYNVDPKYRAWYEKTLARSTFSA